MVAVCKSALSFVFKQFLVRFCLKPRSKSSISNVEERAENNEHLWSDRARTSMVVVLHTLVDRQGRTKGKFLVSIWRFYGGV